jgi:hypothetical protein
MASNTAESRDCVERATRRRVASVARTVNPARRNLEIDSTHTAATTPCVLVVVVHCGGRWRGAGSDGLSGKAEPSRIVSPVLDRNVTSFSSSSFSTVQSAG